ncbi:immunoglobulin domain-containing protein [Flavobacterium cerinum]|uniref:Ig-like domain-containing protein n=1 Tax=Flavobacterium cerinum TaxID=2502784 RepID=A0A444HBK2_9FLAO|nr:hypothetical protein [Flavobacterium cerinum]RWX00773.1 hypothetical protein EPI11_07060 [Flavobacterium cerinum]
MITLTNIKQEKVLHIFYAVVFLFSSISSWSQTYATNATTSNTVLSPNEVVTPGLAYDGLVGTAAIVKANAGGLLGIGAYNGYIELQFPGDVPANTTSYVKIATQDNLLTSLLGGSLGTLLANVLGAVLIGNQEFTVGANYNGGLPIVSGNSQVANDFATDKLRIIRNAAGDYLIAITPNAVYNRIKITNRIGATLLGLGNEKTLSVYEAYYITNPPACGGLLTTSFSGSGITLDLLQLGSAGVTNPQNAIDAVTTNYSELKLGLLGVGASVEQTVYLGGVSQTTDVFGIGLSMGGALLNLDVLNNVTVIASKGVTVVQSRTLSQLLALNLLNMQDGVVTTVQMAPLGAVDRITVRFNSLVSVGLVAQNLNFYGITIRTLAVPLITQNNAVCKDGSASIIATTSVAGAQLKWYSDASGDTLLATTASGAPFVTPGLAVTKTYYVEQFTTCAGLLLPVVVTVLIPPSAGVIAGEQTICLTKAPAALTSVSADSGAGISYKWESSPDGIIWTVIPDAILASYQPDVLLKTTFFHRITTITSGITVCSSNPTSSIKVLTKNCMVVSNPMVRQRLKNGA